MIQEFKKDPYFLSRYYMISSVVFLILIVLSVGFLGHDYQPTYLYWILALVPLIISNFLGVVFSSLLSMGIFLYFRPAEVTPWTSLLVLVGIYIGMLNVPLIHNCAHNQFRPRWLNRVLGELLSVHLMSGFPGFAFLHLRHHQYADDDHQDPHPNGNLTFWQYLNGLKKRLASAYKRNYFDQWGDTQMSRRHWKIFATLVPVGRVLRSLMILTLLGPKLFVFFYVPSFIANQLTYAHINYYCHQKQADGSVAIVNMNHGFYKVLNFLLLGIYFHKTHHWHPQIFNPSKGIV